MNEQLERCTDMEQFRKEVHRDIAEYRRTLTAPTPILFTTLDGVERSFRLTNRRMLEFIRRKADLEGQGEADPLAAFRPNLEFLWAICDNKEDIPDADALVDLIPLDAELISGLVEAIHAEWSSSSKIEANEKYRPTKAETPQSDGSGLPPTGESTLGASASSGN